MSAISSIISAMSSTDPTQRLEAFKNLTSVAVSIRDARTRNELVPYITECTNDDDDILIVIAEELRQFPDLVGGKKYVACLFPALENLISVDSKAVREATVETFKTVC